MNEDTNNLPAISDGDGFDRTEINDRIIQGELLKCVDGNWSGRDGQPAPETPLVVVSTRTILQHWQDGRPIETIIKRAGIELPDVNALNAQIPREQWDLGIDGNPSPPWQQQVLVYLIDEQTAERLTFASGTIGANIAVSNLKTRVGDMRFMRGEGVLPVIELSNKSMKTRWGQKLRPEFKIVGWRDAGGNIAPRIAPPAGGGGLKNVTPPSTEEELRNKVPY